MIRQKNQEIHTLLLHLTNLQIEFLLCLLNGARKCKDEYPAGSLLLNDLSSQNNQMEIFLSNILMQDTKLGMKKS